MEKSLLQDRIRLQGKIKNDLLAQGWEHIIFVTASELEKKRGLKLDFDDAIIRDVVECAADSLAGYGLAQPNAAKIAGHMCYWLCRLRPVRCLPKGDFNRLVNEELALKACLGMCASYVTPKGTKISVDHEIMVDWVASLRNDIDSPNALAISFELLGGKRLSKCSPDALAAAPAT